MANAQPKTYGQTKAIFAEARKRGLDNDALHELVASVLSTQHSALSTQPSIARLTYAEAQKVIQRLKADSFVPLRTLQYRRQKAGIQQVVQESQLTKIAALASQRSWSPEALVKFCKRQSGHHPLRTTQDANKVIEALKSMNKRDGLWSAAA